MNSITTQSGTFPISETVHIERWSGVNQRCWYVLHEDEVVAELTFTPGAEVIKVSTLNVEADYSSDGFDRELLLHLQSGYPAHWIELHPQASSSADGICVSKRANETRQAANLIVQEFDAKMVEAGDLFQHMQTGQWSFNHRMEFYAKFPDFYRREEVREQLVAIRESLPEYLIRVARTADIRANLS